MEVIEQAVEKIKEEMLKESNPYIAYIGNYVLENIEVNKPAAEKIAAGSKTISESFKKVQGEARKIAQNGIAMLAEREVISIVTKYFEFEGVQSSVEDIQTKAEVIEFPKKESIENNPKKAQIDFDASLDDFLV